jgi:hypothetical protein
MPPNKSAINFKKGPPKRILKTGAPAIGTVILNIFITTAKAKSIAHIANRLVKIVLLIHSSPKQALL